MAQQLLVVFVRFAQLRQTSPDLGNHQEVRLRSGSDIPECHAQVVFVDDIRRDISGYNLVEKSGLARIRHTFQVRFKRSLLLIPWGGHGYGSFRNTGWVNGNARTKSSRNADVGNRADGRTDEGSRGVHVVVDEQGFLGLTKQKSL